MKIQLLFIYLFFLSYSAISQDSLLTKGQIYDFEEGDEFRYAYSFSGLNGAKKYPIHRTVIQKIETEDSLIYYFRDTVDNKVLYNYLKLSKASLTEKVSTKARISTGFDGRIINEESKACCGQEPTITYTSFANGLGEVDYSESYVSYGISKELKYFKKGDQIYGAFNVFTGVNEDKSENVGMTVYPNPFQSELFVEFNSMASGDMSIIISNSTGQKLVEQTKKVEKTTKIDSLLNLPAGVYIMSVKLNGQEKNFRIVK